MTQTFFSDPAIDRLVAVTLSLAAEVQVLRDRQRALEGVLRRHGLADEAEIEAWRPEGDEAAGLEAERDLFVRNVLGPLAAAPR
jgi:hypothetical protein